MDNILLSVIQLVKSFLPDIEVFHLIVSFPVHSEAHFEYYFMSDWIFFPQSHFLCLYFEIVYLYFILIQHLTLIYFIELELTFAQGENYASCLIFLYMDIQFSQYHLQKTFFSNVGLNSFVKNNLAMIMSYTLFY